MSSVPPPPPPPPPAGNINVPRTPSAPSAPQVAPILTSDTSNKASNIEVGLELFTVLASLAAFVLLYLDLFQKTKG